MQRNEQMEQIVEPSQICFPHRTLLYTISNCECSTIDMHVTTLSGNRLLVHRSLLTSLLLGLRSIIHILYAYPLCAQSARRLLIPATPSRTARPGSARPRGRTRTALHAPTALFLSGQDARTRTHPELRSSGGARGRDTPQGPSLHAGVDRTRQAWPHEGAAHARQAPSVPP